MKNIVISMQNTLLSEAVARTLAETREFRVEQILPGHADDTLSLCETVRADILLMEVSRLNAYTLESRLSLIDRVRRKIKACKFVLLYYSQSKRYSNVSKYVIMETVMRNEAFSHNRS